MTCLYSHAVVVCDSAQLWQCDRGAWKAAHSAKQCRCSCREANEELTKRSTGALHQAAAAWRHSELAAQLPVRATYSPPCQGAVPLFHETPTLQGLPGLLLRLPRHQPGGQRRHHACQPGLRAVQPEEVGALPALGRQLVVYREWPPPPWRALPPCKAHEWVQGRWPPCSCCPCGS